MLQSLKNLEVVQAGPEPTWTLKEWLGRLFRVGGMDFEARAAELEGERCMSERNLGIFGMKRVRNEDCRLGRGCVAQAGVQTPSYSFQK